MAILPPISEYSPVLAFARQRTVSTELTIAKAMKPNRNSTALTASVLAETNS